MRSTVRGVLHHIECLQCAHAQGAASASQFKARTRTCPNSDAPARLCCATLCSLPVLVAPDPDWAPKPPRLSGPYPLLHEGPFPSSFACDDISHPFDSSQDADRNSPLVLIGIFTMAHKRSVRDLIRKVEMPSYSGSSSSSSSNANETEHTHGDMGIPRGAVEMKFIVGLPKGVRAAAAKGVADPKLQNSQNGQDGRNGQNGQNGAFARQLIPRFWNTQQDPSEEDQAESVKIMDALHKENATYGDIVLLDIEEKSVGPRTLSLSPPSSARASCADNLYPFRRISTLFVYALSMESGKTYAFYRWLSETRSTHRPPRWAMKTDDDSFLILPNILRSLSSFNCAQNIYWGNSWGCAQEFKYHHGGLGYAISWPLVKWLGSTRVRLPVDQVDQNEDARVGTWLAELDPVKEPLITVDYR